MSRFWQHFISNGTGDCLGPRRRNRRRPTSDDALDAFSRVVVHVAEKLRPAVVNLRAAAAAATAPAPASCSRRTAFC